MTGLFAAFAVYEMAINYFLGTENDRLRESVAVLGTCVPQIHQPPKHIEARYEL